MREAVNVSALDEFPGGAARRSKGSQLRKARRDAKFRRAQERRDLMSDEELAAEQERIAAQIAEWEKRRDAA